MKLHNSLRHNGLNYESAFYALTWYKVTVMNEKLITTDVKNQQATIGDGYCTKGDVATKLRCTSRTIELWMQRGLPHYRFGSRKSLFKWSEVESFLAKFRTVRLGKCASAT